MSIRARVLSFGLRHTLKKRMSRFDDLAKLRRQAGASIGRVPATVQIDPAMAGHVPVEWVQWPDAAADRVLLYLHGGGYVFGGLDSHRNIAWRLSKAAGVRVLTVDYRLAPENPYPAALDDAITAYQWLLDQGVAPERLAIAGDSAGGGLSAALLSRLHAEDKPRPAAAALISPWTDLAMTGASMQANAEADAMLSPQAVARFAELYLNGADPRSPFASPLYADLSGLPPTFLMAGSTEVLLSDAETLAARINAGGGHAELKIWDDLPHVFPLFAALLPEARTAIEDIAAFLRRHL